MHTKNARIAAPTRIALGTPIHTRPERAHRGSPSTRYTERRRRRFSVTGLSRDRRGDESFASRSCPYLSNTLAGKSFPFSPDGKRGQLVRAHSNLPQQQRRSRADTYPMENPKPANMLTSRLWSREPEKQVEERARSESRDLFFGVLQACVSTRAQQTSP